MIRVIHLPGSIEELKEAYPVLNNIKQLHLPEAPKDLKPGMVGKFDYTHCTLAKLAAATTRLVVEDTENRLIIVG